MGGGELMRKLAIKTQKSEELSFFCITYSYPRNQVENSTAEEGGRSKSNHQGICVEVAWSPTPEEGE